MESNGVSMFDMTLVVAVDFASNPPKIEVRFKAHAP
jgi:hypothetical protein